MNLPSPCAECLLSIQPDVSSLKLKVPHCLRHLSVFEEVLGGASDGILGGDVISDWSWDSLYLYCTVILLHLHLC